MRHVKNVIILIALVLGLFLAKTARGAEPNPRPVIHLLKGEPAPYDGDLVQPVTLMTLAAEHQELKRVKRKLVAEKKAREIDRVEAEEKLNALRANLDACENQKAPPPLPEPGFFESTEFKVGLGAVLGGLVTWGIFELKERL